MGIPEVNILDKDHVRCAFENRPESFLALTQRIGCPASFNHFQLELAICRQQVSGAFFDALLELVSSPAESEFHAFSVHWYRIDRTRSFSSTFPLSR